jgi:hypothetical protein
VPETPRHRDAQHLSFAEFERRAVYRMTLTFFNDLWDRTAVDAGIEMRHPFLDVRLLETVLRVPDQWLTDGAFDRAFHVRVFGHRLPRTVMARQDKADFTVPWVLAALPFAEWACDRASAAGPTGLVDAGELRAATDALMEDPDASAPIWTWWGACCLAALESLAEPGRHD